MSSSWQIFQLDEVRNRMHRSTVPYLEFLRVPTLSCGIYRLRAGANDLQAPHDEDEVYYVLAGRARVRIDGVDRPVGPGAVLYVAATSEHSFVEIDEDMELLIFFASGGPAR